MALLSVVARTRVWRGLMRRWSNDGVSCSVLKGQLYDSVSNTGAISDVDAWIDTHGGNVSLDTVGFNGSLNLAYRSLLTIDQKSDIMIVVAAMRRGPSYAISILGDID